MDQRLAYYSLSIHQDLSIITGYLARVILGRRRDVRLVMAQSDSCYVQSLALTVHCVNAPCTLSRTFRRSHRERPTGEVRYVVQVRGGPRAALRAGVTAAL